MKTIFLWIAGIVGSLVVIGGVGLFFFIQSQQPAKEERISHRNDLIITSIDQQLQGVDTQAVQAKAHLIEQKSVTDLQRAINSGELTHQELVAYYLIRIKEKDQSEQGNNAVSEVNPNAMAEAKKFDETKDSRLLAGIPVLVKENINTNNMPTSAGSYALKDFVPATNAPVVDELIANGAIIIGKTNLSEMSHYMSQKNPSGYSAKKGQTTNPFNPLVLSPLGSSSGSAVAMATDLATVTLGTETVGSIVAPASVNSVVGFKPTRGNISGEGVIPISHSLDTVGPITKTVEDALVTYNAAALQKLEVVLNKDSLKGKKVGILKSDAKVDATLEQKLKELGAEVVIVEADVSKLDLGFVLKNDFERDLNNYLTTYNAPVQSLAEMVAFNKEDETVRMKYGQTHLEGALNQTSDDVKVQEILSLAQTILNETMGKHGLDVLVSKDNNGAGLAATAGGPEVSVPFGLIEGTPVGATFFGKVGDDANVINIAYSFEQLTMLRSIPK